MTISDDKHITRGEGGGISHTHWTTPTLCGHQETQGMQRPPQVSGATVGNTLLQNSQVDEGEGEGEEGKREESQ